MLADIEERRRALTDLQASLLVEAAAGTGKTSLMAGRAAMLLAAGCEPRGLAAITFTELAASELSVRIRGYVDDLRAGRTPEVLKIAIPDRLTQAQKENLEYAASRFDELTCSTIHGFCQDVIRSYAVEAGLDPGSRVMDESTSDVMFKSSVSEWLISRLSRSATPAEDPIVVLSKNDPLGFESDLLELAKLKRKHPTATTPAPRIDLRPDIDFREAVQDFARWFAASAVKERRTGAIIADLEKLASFYRDSFSAPPTYERLLELAHPPRVESMEWQSFDLTSYGCSSEWRAAAGDQGDRLNSQATQHFESAETEYRKLLGHIAKGLAAPLSSALDEVLQIYARRKRDAAVLDFDDLLHEALKLVSEHEEVRQALGRRFRCVMVDEFQDTDPVQAAFIFLLAAHDRPLKWQDARLRRGSLFLVGDPKQAIYRFRGADIGAYQAARTAMQGQGRDTVIQVTANFRSQKGILDHVNSCFEGVLARDGQPGYVPLTHTIEDSAEKLPCVAKLTVALGSRANANLQRDTEAAAVAALCGRLVGAVEVGRADGSRSPLKPSDIALLTPTRTDLWRYERALEQAGFTVASQAGRTLLQRQETQDVLALVRVLADPFDTLAFGALMRGPLVGLSDEKLLDITERLHRADAPAPAVFSVLTSAEEVVDPVARQVLQCLQLLRRRSAVTTPMLVLAEAVELLRIRVMLAARYRNRSARALANLDALIEMARPYGVSGLRRFARDLQYAWEAQSPRDEGRTDASEDAVELVTIHSSKGLEWPVVIPINTATRLRAPEKFIHRQSDDTLHWVLGRVTPVDLLQVRAEEEHNEARERERIWYVACTRARSLLILPDLPSAFAKSWTKILDLGQAQLPEIDLSDLRLPVQPQPVTAANSQSTQVFSEQAAAIRRSAPEMLWRRPSDHDPDRIEVVDAASDELQVRPDLAASVAGSRLRGILLHKLMEELLSGEVEEQQKALETRARALLEQLISAADEGDARRCDASEVARTALNALQLPEITSLRKRLVPELPIWARNTDGSLVAGRVDAAVMENGSITAVVDWKSDVAPNARDHSMYVAQVAAYLAATGAERGVLVYLTTREVIWIGPGGVRLG
jgi:ATP-dependent exoDNAse (exonuclease V) beta subunit